jgi:crotonobetainyl-CoA:carnitine CoA-transferase CaiB-like acyl-CoA transferase
MKFAVNLLSLFGRDDLVELCRLPPGPGQDPVREFLQATFLTRTKDEWVGYLAGRDLPFAPVQSLPEVLEDAHFRERGALLRDARGWDHVASPIRFQDEPSHERLEPPGLGQHTGEILATLGFDAARCAELEAAGTIKRAPAREASNA